MTEEKLEDKRVQAFLEFLEVNQNDEDFDIASMVEISGDGTLLEYDNEKYLVLTDEEADKKTKNYLKTILDESEWYNAIPDNMRQYFNVDEYAQDELRDADRGSCLNYQNGVQYEISIDGEYFFLYQQ